MTQINNPYKGSNTQKLALLVVSTTLVVHIFIHIFFFNFIYFDKIKVAFLGGSEGLAPPPPSS